MHIRTYWIHFLKYKNGQDTYTRGILDIKIQNV